MKEPKIRTLDASDERQYMIRDGYEVYEKQGVPSGALSFHYHNFYEILYVLEGEYAGMIENQTYYLHKGDFLLIDQNVMHKYHYIEHRHDSSRRIIVWVTTQMLAELSGGSMDLTACFTLHESCAYHFPIYYDELLRGYLLKLAMADDPDAQPGLREVLDRGALTLFFGHLNALCANSAYLSEDENVVQHPLVEQVGIYIETHIGEPITLDQLADHVHMSKYHFLRKFKELTGVTIHTFIVNKRLIRACAYIREGRSITQVSADTGFADYSSFLRNFRAAYGVSPGKYLEYYPNR